MASFRFEKRLNPRKLSIFNRSFSNRSESHIMQNSRWPLQLAALQTQSTAIAVHAQYLLESSFALQCGLPGILLCLSDPLVSTIYILIIHPPQKRLAWALFVLLLSTLVCCQPTEGLLFVLFHILNFPILLAWPLSDGRHQRPPPVLLDCWSRYPLRPWLWLWCWLRRSCQGGGGGAHLHDYMILCVCIVYIYSLHTSNIQSDLCAFNVPHLLPPQFFSLHSSALLSVINHPWQTLVEGSVCGLIGALLEPDFISAPKTAFMVLEGIAPVEIFSLHSPLIYEHIPHLIVE